MSRERRNKRDKYSSRKSRRHNEHHPRSGKSHRYESSSSSDAVEILSGDNTISLDIQLSKFPTKRYEYSDEGLIFGDLHGNFLTAIQVLLQLNIISMNKKTYHSLYRAFTQLEFEVNNREFDDEGNYSLSASEEDMKKAIEAADKIQTLLEKIKKGSHQGKIRVQFAGDILADRRGYDPAFVWFLKTLHNLDIPYSITLSNHDIGLIQTFIGKEALKDYDLAKAYVRLSQLYVYQSLSFARFVCIQQVNEDKFEEFKNELNTYYFPYLSFIDYNLEDGVLSTLTHAASRIEDIQRLVEILRLNMEPSPLATKEQVISAIRNINIVITSILGDACWIKVCNLSAPLNEEGKEDLDVNAHPLLRFIWGRMEHGDFNKSTTMLEDGTKIINYHGHTGDYQKGLNHINLNQECGKDIGNDRKKQTLHIGSVNKIGVIYENGFPLNLNEVNNYSLAAEKLYIREDFSESRKEEKVRKEEEAKNKLKEKKDAEKLRWQKELDKMSAKFEKLEKEKNKLEEKNNNGCKKEERDESKLPEITGTPVSLPENDAPLVGATSWKEDGKLNHQEDFNVPADVPKQTPVNPFNYSGHSYGSPVAQGPEGLPLNNAFPPTAPAPVTQNFNGPGYPSPYSSYTDMGMYNPIPITTTPIYIYTNPEHNISGYPPYSSDMDMGMYNPITTNTYNDTNSSWNAYVAPEYNTPDPYSGNGYTGVSFSNDPGNSQNYPTNSYEDHRFTSSNEFISPSPYTDSSTPSAPDFDDVTDEFSSFSKKTEENITYGTQSFWANSPSAGSTGISPSNTSSEGLKSETIDPSSFVTTQDNQEANRLKESVLEGLRDRFQLIEDELGEKEELQSSENMGNASNQEPESATVMENNNEGGGGLWRSFSSLVKSFSWQQSEPEKAQLIDVISQLNSKKTWLEGCIQNINEAQTPLEVQNHLRDAFKDLVEIDESPQSEENLLLIELLMQANQCNGHEITSKFKGAQAYYPSATK